MDVSTQWDAKAEPADLPATDGLTERPGRQEARGKPKEKICGCSERGQESEERRWGVLGQKEAGDWPCRRLEGRTEGRRGRWKNVPLSSVSLHFEFSICCT